mmetsp:Transcript_26076/g.25684  ORF Transcript_26076/g.25684 Transcript_26076/m.25684 type:complete len:278 (+) Transcript_26076:59-892(+)
MLSRVLRNFASERTAYKPKYFNQDQIDFYNREGFVVAKQVLPRSITDNLQKWAKDMEDLPETPGKWMKYFEVTKGQRLLCRVENFLPFFPELREISYGMVTDMSSDLFGEQAVIYKEKINFKFPQGSGFAAHQDQPAFVSFGCKKLLTVLLPIDANTRQSGGLDFVRQHHIPAEILPQNSDGSLRTDIEAKLNWIPLDAHGGDLVFFDSYAPHRSDVNTSASTRRNLYLTYNPLSHGSWRDKYYEEKRRVFPPECERDPTKDYSEGAKVFNVANPIK